MSSAQQKFEASDSSDTAALLKAGPSVLRALKLQAWTENRKRTRLFRCSGHTHTHTCLGNEAKVIDCIFPEAAVVFRQIKFHGVPVAKWVSLFCLWCVTSGSADPLMPIRPGIPFPSWGRFGVGGAMVRSTCLPVF